MLSVKNVGPFSKIRSASPRSDGMINHAVVPSDTSRPKTQYVPAQLAQLRPFERSPARPESADDFDWEHAEQQIIRLTAELPDVTLQNNQRVRDRQPAESQRNTSWPAHPLFDHVETNATKSVLVTREQKDLLEIADDIIRQTRCELPYGSANHRDYHPDAFVRVVFTYNGSLDFRPEDYISRPRRHALVAAVTKSGNCDQMAAFAYTLARKKLSPQYSAQIVQMPGHTFCRIGKVDWQDDQYIVIDSWPKHAYAVLGNDHFSHGQMLTTIRSKLCKGGPLGEKKADQYASFVDRAKKALNSLLWISHPGLGETYQGQRYTPLYPTPPGRAFKNIHYRTALSISVNQGYAG
jgi:hypothetical protein